MNKKNYALAIAALMGCSALGLQPASANDLSNILGRLSGGNVNYGNQSQIQSNIQVGMTNLQTQIQQAVSTGRMSPIEASNINAEMNRASAMNNDFMRDGVYSASEVQQMLSEFTNLNNMVSAATSGSVNTNVGYGNRGYSNNVGYGSNFGYGASRRDDSNLGYNSRGYGNRYGLNHSVGYNGYGNNGYSNSNVVSLQSRISSNISGAVASRSIGIRQASRMRSQLNNLVAQLNTPGLRYSERSALLDQLRNLDRQVASMGSRYY